MFSCVLVAFWLRLTTFVNEFCQDDDDDDDSCWLQTVQSLQCLK